MGSKYVSAGGIIYFAIQLYILLVRICISCKQKFKVTEWSGINQTFQTPASIRLTTYGIVFLRYTFE
jgi:hypothetical protein